MGSTMKSEATTAWCRVHLKKLMMAQVVKELFAFYGTKNSIPC
jgi:hypothetical protein